MVLDARRGHRLWVSDVRIIAVDEDSSIRNILCEELRRPELPVFMGPGFKRMVIATARIESVNKNEAVKVRVS